MTVKVIPHLVQRLVRRSTHLTPVDSTGIQRLTVQKLHDWFLPVNDRVLGEHGPIFELLPAFTTLECAPLANAVLVEGILSSEALLAAITLKQPQIYGSVLADVAHEGNVRGKS